MPFWKYKYGEAKQHCLKNKHWNNLQVCTRLRTEHRYKCISYVADFAYKAWNFVQDLIQVDWQFLLGH